MKKLCTRSWDLLKWTLNHRISNESPVGKKLIGAKKGATISVDTPAGVIKSKILKVEKPAGAKSAKKTEEKAATKTASKSAAKTSKAADKEEKPAKKTTRKKADK